MVQAWHHLQQPELRELSTSASYRSALLIARTDMTLDAALSHAQFEPSGKRCRRSIGAQIGTGRQPRGRALPQLVPDMLGPEAHLTVAQAVTHPFTRPPTLFPPVQYAIAAQPRDAQTVIRQRGAMVKALDALAEATLDDARFLAARVPWPTLQVLEAGGPLKNIPFMREVSQVIGTVDPPAHAGLCLGIANDGMGTACTHPDGERSAPRGEHPGIPREVLRA